MIKVTDGVERLLHFGGQLDHLAANHENPAAAILKLNNLAVFVFTLGTNDFYEPS